VRSGPRSLSLGIESGPILLPSPGSTISILRDNETAALQCFWTITAGEMPPSVHNHGYSATREQAMKDFKG